MDAILFTSDWHLGLKTEGMLRNKEVLAVGEQICARASKLKDNGDSVSIVLGGDVFNSPNPSELDICDFLSFMNAVSAIDVPLTIMGGNHDAKSGDPDNLFCLNFIKRLQDRYPNVSLVEDITIKKKRVYDFGPLYLVYLPHISSSTLATKKKDYGSASKYIEANLRNAYEKMGKGASSIVFSHLHIEGLYGAESKLLKVSDARLPSFMTAWDMAGYNEPLIVSGHIHNRMKKGNLHIVGAPFNSGFGEADGPKGFAQINIPNTLGNDIMVQYHNVPVREFKEIDLDLTQGVVSNVTSLPEYASFLESLKADDIVKISIKSRPENLHINWDVERARIAEKYGCTVKNIIPNIVRERVTRDDKQELGIPPVEAVKRFIGKRLRNDKETAKRRFTMAKEYLGSVK